MQQGFLSQYFVSVAAKTLSVVEADASRSNQHEFNGSRELKRVFGTGTGERECFTTRFIWFGTENEGIVSDGSVTWYDARLAHPTRSEYRLYFPGNDVMELAQAGDTLFIAKRTDDSVLIIITEAGTTLENQLYWLFGLSRQSGLNFSLNEFEDNGQEVDFTVRFILDELGIDIEEPETDRLDDLLQRFQGQFPSTRIFSEFARNNLETHIDILDDPDHALMSWLNFEEQLFRRLERHIVAQRLEQGFTREEETDVDGFVSFSLSVHNRRKSRAGHSFENHLQQIFDVHGLRYDRGARTENNAKPDFLFPGSTEYRDSNFSPELLTMLGVKTTCKDRWRQVLSEARRIDNKHLITLEPGITLHQTNEMIANNLQLVVPEQIQSSYLPEQQRWLLNLDDMIQLVEDKQTRIR